MLVYMVRHEGTTRIQRADINSCNFQLTFRVYNSIVRGMMPIVTQSKHQFFICSSRSVYSLNVPWVRQWYGGFNARLHASLCLGKELHR